MRVAIARDIVDAVLSVGEVEMPYSCYCGRGYGIELSNTNITCTPGVCPLVDNTTLAARNDREVEWLISNG